MPRQRSLRKLRPLVASRRTTPWRSLRGWLLRTGRRLSLSQRFLIAAALIVTLAMALLGNWIGIYLQQGITNGVVSTAAASVEAMVAQQFGEIAPGSTITEEQRSRLNAAFRIGNEADQTRLLQIRLRDVRGKLIYEAEGGLMESGDEDEELRSAAVGQVTARIIDVPLSPIGPIKVLPITVLEIYTPLRRTGDGALFGTAELYYSATSVLELRDKAQRDVWVLVGLFGLLLVGALYLLVNSASHTIGRQRERLAGNLAASRRLSDENRLLRDAADDLRLAANSANEGLLAKVGSDIHDGPIQLLTLIILRLTRASKSGTADLPQLTTLATQTMTDLRNISTGLVLPELRDLGLQETIALAARRHEDQTGSVVEQRFSGLDGSATLAVKIAAFRVVQEALTNAFRHGGGVGQAVTASIDNGVLNLDVENQISQGTAPEPVEPDAQLGLRGMRFRVESLGGQLSVAISPDSARVSAKIPIAADRLYA